MTPLKSIQQALQMLTIEQAAEELGLSVDEAQRLLDCGLLDCYRLGQDGSKVRIIRRDLTRFVTRAYRRTEQPKAEQELQDNA